VLSGSAVIGLSTSADRSTSLVACTTSSMWSEPALIAPNELWTSSRPAALASLSPAASICSLSPSTSNQKDAMPSPSSASMSALNRSLSDSGFASASATICGRSSGLSEISM
jgi:hypothetical protein